jgi:hypothetical protein
MLPVAERTPRTALVRISPAASAARPPPNREPDQRSRWPAARTALVEIRPGTPARIQRRFSRLGIAVFIPGGDVVIYLRM